MMVTDESPISSPLWNLPRAILVICLCFCFMIGVIGICGNMIALLVYKVNINWQYQITNHYANTLIYHLAMTDFICSVVIMPLYIVVLSIGHQHPFIDQIFKTCIIGISCIQGCLLIIIFIDRCVIHSIIMQQSSIDPFRFRSKYYRKAIVVTWILTLVFMALNMGKYLFPYQKADCLKIQDCTISGIPFFTLPLLIWNVVSLSLAIISMITLSIYQQIANRISGYQYGLETANHSSQRQQFNFKMYVAVGFSVLLCKSPLSIIEILFQDKTPANIDFQGYVIVILAAMTTTILNPILYYIFDHNYRSKCRCRYQSNDQYRQPDLDLVELNHPKPTQEIAL